MYVPENGKEEDSDTFYDQLQKRVWVSVCVNREEVGGDKTEPCCHKVVFQ